MCSNKDKDWQILTSYILLAQPAELKNNKMEIIHIKNEKYYTDNSTTIIINQQS